MLETTMVAAAERGARRQRELLADPVQARQTRFARPAGRYDPAARREPARSSGGTRAAPRVRAFRLRHQPS